MWVCVCGGVRGGGGFFKPFELVPRLLMVIKL
jgi:hypothetical protein